MAYSWIIFAFLSAVFASLVAIFGKIGLEKVDANTATAIRAVIMTLFLVGVIIAQGKLPEIAPIFKNSKAITYIFLSGIAGALSWLFYFMALKIGKASLVASIDRFSLVFVIIFATLFLGENLSLRSGIGVALVAVGTIIIALG
jgi:bacterial/archaeal transporter family protein